MLLAKALGKREEVTQNHLWFDPVPGNLICTQRMDIFKVTLARKGMDLSSVTNFGRVTAIYPKEPLCDIACHAPVIPVVQKDVNFNCFVVDECHQGALLAPAAYGHFHNTVSAASYVLCKTVLTNRGVQFPPGVRVTPHAMSPAPMNSPARIKRRPVHAKHITHLPLPNHQPPVRASWIPVTVLTLRACA